MDELARHAAALREAGAGFAATGARVNATWQGLSGVYDAPEVGQLLAATAPVQTISASAGADIGTVANALATYASEVRQIQAQLEALRGQAQAFVDTNTGNDDWEHDDSKVDHNNQLISAVDAQVAAFYEAQRRCANAINALYGGPQYRADNGDGRLTDGEYGYTAQELDSAAGQDGALPWGSTQEHDRGLLGDIGAFWSGFGHGAVDFVTGLGALIGRDPTTGAWSWGTASTAWKGLGTFALAVGVYLTPGGAQLDQRVGVPGMRRGQLGDTLLTAGKSLIAYDEWGQDKSRAAGMATFNVVSAVLGTKGAGAGLRGAGAIAEGSRIAAVSKAGTIMLRSGEAIGKLPTITDLAKGVANRFPSLRLPTFGATAHVDVPHHVDTPTVHAPQPELPTTPSPGSVGDTLHHTPATTPIADTPASTPPTLVHHIDSPAPHHPETPTATHTAGTGAPHHADARGPDSPTPSHPTDTSEPQHPGQHVDPPAAQNTDLQHPTPPHDASIPAHADPPESAASRPDPSADAPAHSPEGSTSHPAAPHDAATPTHPSTSTDPVATSANHPHPASDPSLTGHANAHEHLEVPPDGTPHPAHPHEPASPDHSEQRPTAPTNSQEVPSLFGDTSRAADAMPLHDPTLPHSSIHHHADGTSPVGVDADHDGPAHLDDHTATDQHHEADHGDMPSEDHGDIYDLAHEAGQMRDVSVRDVASIVGVSDPGAVAAVREAYDVAHKYSAPFIVKIADDMLADLKNDLAENPDRRVVFVGRDGRGLALAVRALDPHFFARHCTEVVLSRALAETAIHDLEHNSGKSFPELADFRGAAGKVDRSAISGGVRKLTDYLHRSGVPVGLPESYVTLVDTSYKGTVQELLAAVYPETSFEGRYAFFARSPSDPHPGTKQGYVVHLEGDRANGGLPQRELPDDPRFTFSNKDAIATVEETLHGPLSSPKRIGTDGPVQQFQRYEPSQLDGFNPRRVSGQYSDPAVREGVMHVNLRAVDDFARQVAAVRQSGDGSRIQLAEQAEQYQRQVRAWINGSGADPRFARIMDSFVRRSDKSVAAKLAEFIARADLPTERADAVWEAYERCPTDEDKRAFVVQFERARGD